MKFQVPQFVDIEDKILAQLSFKEFIYILGGAGLTFLIYRLIPSFIVALIFIIPVIALTLALAFYKPNNKPFIEMLQAAIVYFMSSKLYLWKKKEVTNEDLIEGYRENNKDKDESMIISSVGQSSLSDISFGLSAGTPKDKAKGGLNLKI